MSTRILSVFSFLKRVGFAVLLLGATILALAQPPDTLWTRRYGREYHDLAHSVAQTPDGGFIIAGETWNAEVFETRNADAYVVKVDSLGNEEWSHSWGGEFSDEIHKIIVLDDGYIAAGNYQSTPPADGNHSDGWILRLNCDGDTLWTRRYDIAVDAYGLFYDMIEVEDDEFIAVGWSGLPQTNLNLWMVKISSGGDTIWTRSYGGPWWEQAWAVALAQDGGYVACGFTSSFGAGSNDMWMIKVSQAGDSLWSRTFGYGGLEEARAIALAPDGGFFLGGYSSSLSETYDDAWIVRTDAEGNYLWDIDLAGINQLGIEALVATEDGGVIAAGRDDPAGTNGQALYMAKVDSAGDSVWARSWFQDWYSDGEALISLRDGGFAAAGVAGWHTRFEPYTTGDMWLIRLSPDMSPVSPIEPFLPDQFDLTAFPNPFNPQTTLSFTLPQTGRTSLTVFDVLGRVVQSYPAEVLQAGRHQIRLDAGNLATGSYWVKLATESKQDVSRVLLIR